MELWEKVSRQRVRYIVDSYQLDGEDSEYFDDYLEDLMQAYPPPQIELALVEVLIESWQAFPIVRGMKFLERSHQLLRSWENTERTIAPFQVSSKVSSKISSLHFQLITGLDPTPVFGDSKTAGMKAVSPSH